MYVLWKHAKDDEKEEIVLPLIEKISFLTKNWGRMKLIIAKLNATYRINEKYIQQIIDLLKEQIELEKEVIAMIHELLEIKIL